MGFMDLEKAYDRVNWEAQWQVLKKYDLGGKLLDGIEDMYVTSLVCVRIKGVKNEYFRNDSWMKHGWIISSWLFKVHMDAVMKKVKCG